MVKLHWLNMKPCYEALYWYARSASVCGRLVTSQDPTPHCRGQLRRGSTQRSGAGGAADVVTARAALKPPWSGMLYQEIQGEIQGFFQFYVGYRVKMDTDGYRYMIYKVYGFVIVMIQDLCKVYPVF